MVKSLNTIVVSAFLVLFSYSAMGQDGPNWKKVCENENDPKSCRLTQQLFLSQKDKDGNSKTVGRILGVTVLYIQDSESNKREPYMSLQLPLGVDLRPGAVMRVDEGKEIPLQYLRCTGAGCDASLKLDADLVKAMKAGNDISLGFRAWGSEQVRVVKASLKGFTAAFNAIK